MPLWLFLLISLGGLLLIGIILDLIIKKKNIKVDLQKGVTKASESERTYTEKALDEARRKMGSDGNNWS